MQEVDEEMLDELHNVISSNIMNSRVFLSCLLKNAPELGEQVDKVLYELMMKCYKEVNDLLKAPTA